MKQQTSPINNFRTIIYKQEENVNECMDWKIELSKKSNSTLFQLNQSQYTQNSDNLLCRTQFNRLYIILSITMEISL